MLNWVSQELVVEKLNDYFKANNLPLKMNEGGICNGLAHVYALYALTGKEDKFYAILKAITTGSIDSSLEPGDFELFITQVLLSFLPEKYNKELSQSNAIKTFQDKLSSVFALGMVLDNQAWQLAFKDIDLQDDEVMIVSSVNHTIAVSKKNGQYKIYDPNYLWAFHTVNSERSLVNELHHGVFCYEGNTLGLHVQVIKNKTQLRKARSSPLSFYQRYLTPDLINRTASIAPLKARSLLFAIECDDDESVLYLLNNGAEVSNGDLARAIIHNKVNVLRKLIEKRSTFDELLCNSCIIAALSEGRYESFQVLMEYPAFKSQFDTLFLNTNKLLLVKKAALGGNIKLLEFIIDACERDTTEEHDLATCMNRWDVFYGGYNNEQVLMAAIEGGSSECIKLLINTFNTKNILLRENVKMNCMMRAIKTNQLVVCNTLLAEIPPSQLGGIKMSLDRVEKTNVFILKALKAKGVHFSAKAEAIIAKKEQQSIGFLLLIGIELTKFYEYITKKQDIVVVADTGTTNSLALEAVAVSQFPNKSQFFQQGQQQVTDEPTNAIQCVYTQ
jgi:hypothetical protein